MVPCIGYILKSQLWLIRSVGLFVCFVFKISKENIGTKGHTLCLLPRLCGDVKKYNQNKVSSFPDCLRCLGFQSYNLFHADGPQWGCVKQFAALGPNTVVLFLQA